MKLRRKWLFSSGGAAFAVAALAAMHFFGPEFGFRKYVPRATRAVSPAKPALEDGFFAKQLQLERPGRYKHFLYQQPFLYISMGLDGLTLLDCSTPARPRLIRHWKGEEFCHPLQIAAKDGYFFIADRFQGLLVAELHDAQAPKILARIPVPGIATALQLQGAQLSVACGKSGALIFDVTDPLQPKQIYSWSERIDYTTGVCLNLQAIYLADSYSGGFKVLRIGADGIKFQKLYHTPSYCDDVLISGGRIYTNNREDGILTYDLTDQLNPVFVSRINLPGDASTDFVIRDNLLLVAYKFYGVAAYDISVAAQPKFLGSYQIGEKTETLCLVGDYAYVGNDAQGISILALNREQMQ